MTTLDIISFNALDAERHLLRVSNSDFRNLVHERLAPRLSSAQIELYDRLLQADRSRYIACSAMDQSLDEQHEGRYSRYRRSTRELVVACVDALLAKAAVDPKSIRAVVSNTTVGGMVPNLTSIVSNHLGLNERTKVVDLGYMGCATALLALELVEAQLAPGEVGLVVSSEITSVMINLLADSDASLIANTVFGDGIGAFLVARRPHRERTFLRILGHTGSLLADDQALAAITYEANAVYHEIRLKSTISEVASRGIRYAVEPLVRRHLVSSIDKLRYLATKRAPKWQRHVDFAVLHTAGSKVLEGVCRALEMEPEKVHHNFEAFRQYGNTSSASLYYSLHELEQKKSLQSGQTLMFLGYGSGFFTRGAVMEVVRNGIH